MPTLQMVMQIVLHIVDMIGTLPQCGAKSIDALTILHFGIAVLNAVEVITTVYAALRRKRKRRDHCCHNG